MPTPRKHEGAAARQRAYRERVLAARLAERELKGLPCAPSIPTMPPKARWRATIVQAAALLCQVEREIQEYIDDRSELWQESEQAEHLEECRQAIEDVAETLGLIQI
jgi:hypothetical protein